ncbi:carbamate kinase [Lactobacillus sp. ESL0701]|uniref:carbamate kinase n=1 Tax=Lactobacillus sp. ESL0701 TaxID=2983217 RepID=UPI0023F7FB5F|nr:carbamate kinase [Lactobacillus sp. ESL0701]MDF7671812.1 carbamate kinase [Lactobacillus sp. ESL0701]
MANNRIVVALGGNAILSKDPTAQAQQEAVKKTASALVNFIKNGDELIITHGNGPQVGNLLLQQLAANSEKNPAMPLDTVGAMTEGSIGYWFQNALQEETAKNNIDKDIVTVVTQTIVNAEDPAFEKPSKPIGPFYSKEEADDVKKAYPDWTLVEDSGRGYRRVVPSPKPQAIKEIGAIQKMIANGIVPIVSGGGGIPVVKDGAHFTGKEAVIDKDFSAAKVAELVSADKLIILTAVDGVCINFGKPNQTCLTKTNVKELEEYIAEDQFAAGSMLPKVQAALTFVKNTGKKAIIGSLDNVNEIIAGNTGTVIEL